ncbi:uncharacterized protein [Eucyclogobius newberryi]|uniref:uncharacterized protein n=1 Tax=Eucyclogobius newberryi TaxID=166745 RepID=UPI003B5AE0A0
MISTFSYFLVLAFVLQFEVSRAPPGPDVSLFTLQCFVSRHSRQCEDGTIVWSDHEGKITTNVQQSNCVSYLTVERRHIRTFTCQVLDAENKVLISADFTPETDHALRFSRAGANMTLPCERLKHLGPDCSRVNWLHYKDSSSSSPKVSEGQIQGSDSRLKLNSDCSLTVQSVSAQDSGIFLCRQGNNPDSDTTVHLSVLTVSSAPADPDQNITLRCTLSRYTGLTCSSGRFLWVDQDHQKVLSERRETCESDLTVELQSPHTRTFTCQYQEEGEVLVSAEYSLMVQENKDLVIYTISGAVASVLLLLIVATVVFVKIKHKRSPQAADAIYAETNPADSVMDPDYNLTYAMINHQKSTPRNHNQVEVEYAVTYSSVTVKKNEETNNSAIYSTVKKR